jgi:predicted RNA-binding Zn ribbon-like protein
MMADLVSCIKRISIMMMAEGKRQQSTTSMAKRKLVSIARMPLVGRRICLDLVNTTGARDSTTPRERLKTYRDALVWSRRVGILTAHDHRTLEAKSTQHAQNALKALVRIRKIRETLYRLLRAVAEGEQPSAGDVAQLNRLWQKDRARRELAVGGRGFDVRLRTNNDELDRIIWPIIESAVGLLTSDDVVWLKRCGECDWLFVDESKNHSRTWCKKVCGDRVRARRHYRRLRSRAHQHRGDSSR